MTYENWATLLAAATKNKKPLSKNRMQHLIPKVIYYYQMRHKNCIICIRHASRYDDICKFISLPKFYVFIT